MDAPITHVHVERLGVDEVVVTWRGPVDAVVFLSSTPDDAGTEILELDGPRRVVVHGAAATERRYVHLLAADGPFVVAAERLVPLEGARNFRDLGGYVGAAGRRVAWGRVFRSDHLSELTDGDRAALDRLGVRTAVDLRGPHEHASAPSSLVDGGPIERIDLPVADGSVDGVPLRELVATKAIDGFTVEEMIVLYTTLLEDHADTFAAVLALAADAGRRALVYHCTAGKDRTGLASALLLATLGVGDATILDDYELTNRYRSQRRVEELRPVLADQGIDIDRFLPLFTAPRRALAGALAATRERHGSLEHYLVDAGGLDPDVPALLRDQLLEPA